MGQKQSLEDQLKNVKEYCKKNGIDLGFEYDPIADNWEAFEGETFLAGPCDEFDELLEALEAEFSI